MYLQVKNSTKSTFNQFRTSKENLIKEVKLRGWKLSDCIVSEIRSELVDNTYKGVDGKTLRKY